MLVDNDVVVLAYVKSSQPMWQSFEQLAMLFRMDTVLFQGYCVVQADWEDIIEHLNKSLSV